MKNGIACVVVLYNPSTEIINKTIEYSKIFERVILVDNSDTVVAELCDNNKVKYIPLLKNMGIAFALNTGINKAKEMGFEWVMTLDQDSTVTIDCVIQLYNTIQTITDKKVAIVSANYEPNKFLPIKGVENVHFVITSGTVLKTEVFAEVGTFIEDMFIDAVDYEYCYRLISKGYKILRDNNAIFAHVVGNPTYVKGIKCRNYPAFRYYFITRNNLIVSKLYKKCLPESMELREHIKKYQKSAWYENYKWRKQLFIFIAKFDYLLWLITHKYYCNIKI